MKASAGNWTSVAVPKGTVFETLNKGFENKHNAIPSFQDSRTILIGSIAANDEMLTDLTKAFGWVTSSYLSFDLGHIRCGTTKCDNGSLQIEDFVAIPDLIAGAISEQFRYSLSAALWDDKFFCLSGPEMNKKARPITFWFGTSQKHLKKHLFVIDPGINENTLKVSWFNFTH